MEIEKLIERLKNYSIKDKALLNLQTVKDAAEALEKLQAENESLKNKLHDSYQGHLLDVVIPRLEAELEKAKMARPIELTGKGAEAFALAAELSETKQELEKVKAERDAAVSDLETVMAYGGGNLDTCQFCKNAQCYARGGRKPCLPKWRGRKAE